MGETITATQFPELEEFIEQEEKKKRERKMGKGVRREDQILEDEFKKAEKNAKTEKQKKAIRKIRMQMTAKQAADRLKALKLANKGKSQQKTTEEKADELSREVDIKGSDSGVSKERQQFFQGEANIKSMKLRTSQERVLRDRGIDPKQATLKQRQDALEEAKRRTAGPLRERSDRQNRRLIEDEMDVREFRKRQEKRLKRPGRKGSPLLRGPSGK